MVPAGQATLWLLTWSFTFLNHLGPVMSGNMMAKPSPKPSAMSPVMSKPKPTPLPQFTKHSGQVCSTWGNYYFKTFDGDIYHYPGKCKYVFASHCKGSHEDFSIVFQRTEKYRMPVISQITLKINDVVVEISNTSITMDGDPVTEIPHDKNRVYIDRISHHLKITFSSDLFFMWNGEDSMLLKLNPNKYKNQICGLCGNFDGIVGFSFDGIDVNAVQFGNKQKQNGPMEDCPDVPDVAPSECRDVDEICKSTLTSKAFSECNSLVPPEKYIEVCVEDLCRCRSKHPITCLCKVFAEYSHQCTHAGGVPKNWRTPKLCPKKCPFNMEYHEFGSPCIDTCSNTERSIHCEDHGIDGCFCPKDTVHDDIGNQGCIPQKQCPCVYNGKIYQPDSSYITPCRKCTCFRGRWKCKELQCTGTCSVEGGSHITTFDGTHYSFNGDCSYVLAKHCTGHDFTVLGEIRRCTISNSKSCLKGLIVSMNGGDTVVAIKENGIVFFNWMPLQLPISVANMTISQPTTFFLNIQTTFGLSMQIQYVPILQLYIYVDSSYQHQTCGLCGNFNNMQTDDFKALSGVIEGTAAAFVNTWKTLAICPNIKNSYEDPCSLNVEKEKYAQHWCGLITSPTGPFSACHSLESPLTYYTKCLSDTCSCTDSEVCMCAAISSYVYACARKGVQFSSWRDNVCQQYAGTCKDSQEYHYHVTQLHPTCHSLSKGGVMEDVHFTPVDGCVCRDGTYMNDHGDCVVASSCPCYYQGNVMQSGEMIEENGVACTCDKGQLNCIGTVQKTPVCAEPLAFLNCTYAPKATKGVECQKSCDTLDMDCYSSQCISGCVCPAGLVSDGEGGCVPELHCPCIHNEASYKPGSTISVGCNTCKCMNRKWICSLEQCLGTCSVYGDGHHMTFDNKHFTFSGNCEYTLVQDNCGEERSQSTFRVIMQNVHCGSTDTMCSKMIKIFIGGQEVLLDNEKIEVVKRDEENLIGHEILRRGMYLLVKSENGATVIWDTKVTMHIKLSSNFKRKVCGICGNYDGNANNDFTTRSLSVVENLMEFGNSWKTDPKCPDVQDIKEPCSIKPHRKVWAIKHCGIITSDVFKACHSQVDPNTYYDSCIRDSCSCDSGGDCECFCTAVAAYAQACSETGICIKWRTPNICPMFCDYFNDDGECEWHYKACGDTCMKTCQNPKGECLDELSGLEGCYPKCPASRPFLNEDTMKCVSHCGCHDEEGNFYNYGGKVPAKENCHYCMCSKKGISCQYDITACQCKHEGKMYNYKEIIHTSNNDRGDCIQMLCDVNGTTVTVSHLCNTKPTGAPQHKTSQLPCDPVCYWTKWHNVPTISGDQNGGNETYNIISSKGQELCKHEQSAQDVECRISDLINEHSRTKQILINSCSLQNGLICSDSNAPNTLKPCKNVEIRFSCCKDITSCYAVIPPTPFQTNTERTLSTPRTTFSSDTSTSTLPTTSSSKSHQSTSSIFSAPKTTILNDLSTTSISPVTSATPTTSSCYNCSWTDWHDEKHPTSAKESGDRESFEMVALKVKAICRDKSAVQRIRCRSSSYRNTRFEDLGQKATCDVEKGLICENEDNPGPGKMCLNYEVQFYCCQTYECSTTTVTTTTPTSSSASSKTTMAAGYPEATTRSSNSPISITTTPNLSSKSHQSTSSIFSTPKTTILNDLSTTSISPVTSTTPTTSSCYNCSWTDWHDEKHPTSAKESGDRESFEMVAPKVKAICRDKSAVQRIRCRSSSYRNTRFEDLGQKATCDVEKGLICENEDNPGPGKMCLNYEVQFYCCQTYECSTTTVTTTTPTSSSASSKTTMAAGYPEATTRSSNSPISITTTPNLSSKSHQSTSSIFSTPKTTILNDLSTTSISPVTSTTPTTSSCYNCSWTDWHDEKHPTSAKESGDRESFEMVAPKVKAICRDKSAVQRIRCRSSSYRNTHFEDLGQKATCDVEKGLICENEDNPGPGKMCLNYEVQFYCCQTYECSTTTVTTTTPTSSSASSKTTMAAGYPEATTRSSNSPTSITTTPNLSSKSHQSTSSIFSTPKTTILNDLSTTSISPVTSTTPTTSSCYNCSWTDWHDEKHPTSAKESGDRESFEMVAPKVKAICRDKSAVQRIRCRSSSYRNTRFEDLGQKATCDVEKGLICENEDNPGPGKMCLNYEVQFYCCQTYECSTTTVTTTTPTSSSASSKTTMAAGYPEATTRSSSSPISITTTPNLSSKSHQSTSSIFSTPKTTILNDLSTTSISPVTSATPSSSSCYNCSWTDWHNEKHPTSAKESGDRESFEMVAPKVKAICRDKSAVQRIRCRSSSYRNTRFEDLGQKATCDVEKGLICENADNPGPGKMCLNYEVQFYCCQTYECSTTTVTTTTPTSSSASSKTTMAAGYPEATTRSSNSPISITTASNLSSKSHQSTSSIFSTPKTTILNDLSTTSISSVTSATPTSSSCYNCSWTDWHDEKHPTSAKESGDRESFEMVAPKVKAICRDKSAVQRIRCRSSSYRNTRFEDLGQKATCDVEKGLICENEDNPGPGRMCLNYEVQFYCCQTYECSTTTVTTTTPTSSSASSKTTMAAGYPEATTRSSNSPISITTAPNLSSKSHQSTSSIFSTPKTTILNDLSTTSISPVTSTTPTTSSCYNCSWTDWHDEKHPTSAKESGDRESFEMVAPKVKAICRDKSAVQRIRCRSSSYRNTRFEDLGQKATCDVEKGLICENEDNPGPGKMCLNYEVQFYCCQRYECSTTTVTTTTPTSSSESSKTTMAAGYPEATTRSSNSSISITTTPNLSSKSHQSTSSIFSTPKTTILNDLSTTSISPVTSATPTTSSCYNCSWTDWHDEKHPTSAKESGDRESFEMVAPKVKAICRDKSAVQRIRCRSSSYRNTRFEDLGQKATCDVEKGLICENEDNPGPGKMCLNYEIQFYCCQTYECSTTTVTTTTPTSSSASSKTTMTAGYPEATTRSSNSPISITTTPNLSSKSHQSTSSIFSTPKTTILNDLSTTSISPVTSATPSSSSCYNCSWTDWHDEKHPTSAKESGDRESFEMVAPKVKAICRDKSAVQRIRCRSSSYRNTRFEDLGQKATCDVEKGLICENADNPGPGKMCLNYEVQFYCCQTYECSTTTVTTTTPTSSSASSKTTMAAGYPEATTRSSNSPISITTAPNLSSKSHQSTSSIFSTPKTTILNDLSTTSISPVTSATPTTSSCYNCSWTDWHDEKHPTSAKESGDRESFEMVAPKVKAICRDKSAVQRIRCRSSSYRNTRFEDLGQKATCDVEKGLICENEDNPGPGKMCLNYEVQFYCCQTYECSTTTVTTTTPTSSSASSKTTMAAGYPEATTRSSNSPISITTTPNLSSKSHQSTSSIFSTPKTTILNDLSTTSISPVTSTTPTTSSCYNCSWTDWHDEKHPTSAKESGDRESFEMVAPKVKAICRDKSAVQRIRCRSSSYRNTRFEDLGQKATCDVEKGLICENEDNPGPGKMCLNYEVQFYCCQTYECSTTTVTTTTSTSSSASSKTTMAAGYPEATTRSSNSSISITTTPNLSSKSHQSTSSIFSTPKTTILNDLSTTSISPVTSATPTTSSCYNCFWTDWHDEKHPTSARESGDRESFEMVAPKVKAICRDKSAVQRIRCRSSSYRNTRFEDLGQKATCDVEKGLICENEDNPGPGKMCLNYEIQFYCCQTYECSTTTVTTTTSTSSSASSKTTMTAGYPEATTRSSNSPISITTTPNLSSKSHQSTSSIFSTPKTTILNDLSTTSISPVTSATPSSSSCYNCSWTDWHDEKHPTSAKESGDRESFEMVAPKVKAICRDKSAVQRIRCRSSSYRNTRFEDLGQKATCDVEKGLICENEDNPGPGKMCLNYEVQFYCCQTYECSTTTVTTTTPTSSSASSKTTMAAGYPEATTRSSNSSISITTTPNLSSKSHQSTSSLFSPTPTSTIETPTLSTGGQDICVYDDLVYEVGSPIPMPPESCQDCRCTASKNNIAKIACKPIVCHASCALGYTYQKVKGQCCGKCVQTYCVLNNSELIKPGKWWHPPGDNCTSYNCEADTFIIVKQVMACPKQKPLKCDKGIVVDFTSTDGCCTIKYCEPRRCDVIKSWKVIEIDGCVANVSHTNCGGYCSSISSNPDFPKMEKHACTCCQASKTTTKKMELQCDNGKRTEYTGIDILQCECRKADCVFLA